MSVQMCRYWAQICANENCYTILEILEILQWFLGLLQMLFITHNEGFHFPPKLAGGSGTLWLHAYIQFRVT